QIRVISLRKKTYWTAGIGMEPEGFKTGSMLRRFGRVCCADLCRNVESAVGPKRSQPAAVAMGRIERQGRTILEAHRHQQTTAKMGSQLQRPNRAALQHLAPFRSVGGPPRKRRLRKSNLEPQSLLQTVFLEEPSFLQIPPGERRKSAVET